MKTVRHIPPTIFIYALTYAALIAGNRYAAGIFNFVTWFICVTLLLTTLIPITAKRTRETYRAGKHAPAWFDVITYIVPILTCAAFNHYALATAWTITATLDFAHRLAAKEPERGNPNN